MHRAFQFGDHLVRFRGVHSRFALRGLQDAQSLVGCCGLAEETVTKDALVGGEAGLECCEAICVRFLALLDTLLSFGEAGFQRLNIIGWSLGGRLYGRCFILRCFLCGCFYGRGFLRYDLLWEWRVASDLRVSHRRLLFRHLLDCRGHTYLLASRLGRLLAVILRLGEWGTVNELKPGEKPAEFIVAFQHRLANDWVAGHRKGSPPRNS